MIKEKKATFKKPFNTNKKIPRWKIRTLKNDLPVVSRAGEYYKTSDGDFLEILRINGTSGIRRFTNQAYLTLITSFTEGVRTLTQPSNYVVLDFLVDHQEQIDFYNYKIDRLDVSNPVDQAKLYWLEQEIQKLEYRQLHATEEQYFLLLFAETLAELESQINVAFEIPHLNVEKLKPKYKDAFIFKMNNLNSSPYNILRGDADAE